MADINSFSFTGRLGTDATVKTTLNGKTCLEMSVAVTSGYGDYKKTLWAKVKQWGERGNNIVDIFKKGSLIGGTGEISLNTWTGKDSTEHTDIVITCMSVQILSSKKDGQGHPSEPAEDVAVF